MPLGYAHHCFPLLPFLIPFSLIEGELEKRNWKIALLKEFIRWFYCFAQVKAFMSLPEFKCNATINDYVPHEVYENKMAMVRKLSCGFVKNMGYLCRFKARWWPPPASQCWLVQRDWLAKWPRWAEISKLNRCLNVWNLIKKKHLFKSCFPTWNEAKFGKYLMNLTN